MRICDVCLAPGDLTEIRGAATSPVAGKPSVYIWGPISQGNNPDLCGECLELLQSKSWSELGERHRHGLNRFLEQDDERT